MMDAPSNSLLLFSALLLVISLLTMGGILLRRDKPRRIPSPTIDPTDLTLLAEVQALRHEGLRLQEQLQQQQLELTQELRQATFEQLQTLLTSYPSLRPMIQVKPELPAKNLLSLFTPLDNLLESWGYVAIGAPWEQVPYDPQLHQPDCADMVTGELVYVRFVGYQEGDPGKGDTFGQLCYRTPPQILCPAKVSRTLPGGQS
jgi:hypothetical protein